MNVGMLAIKDPPMRQALIAIALSATLSALGACAPAASSPAAGPLEGRRVALVELFTSQGCSSCPAADAVMQRVAADPGAVVILRPVTYWDQQGWRDTLARPENTAKQFAYARALGVQPYTPQAVIDGRTALVGSQEANVRALIRAARGHAETAALEVTRSQGQAHIVVTGANGAAVSLVGLAPSRQVAIGNGENSGRTITYVNVVRVERSLGAAQGNRAIFDAALDAGPTRDATHWAVVVQDGEAGLVRAAAFVP